MSILLVLYKNGKTYDISDLAESIVWKGRKGSAARSLNISLLDDSSGRNAATADIDIMRGDHIIFYFDNKELFRGIIMSKQQTDKHKMSTTAYDNGIYLANNKDTFVYENKTLHDIFIDVCRRFEIKFSIATDTTYRIPELTKPKTTAWDVIMDAISQDFKATGKVSGKGLSTNDFTDAYMTKLNGISTEANKTIVDSAMSDTSTNPVQNKIVNARFKAADDVVAALSNSLQSAYNRISTLEDLIKNADVALTQISDHVTWTAYSCKRQGNLVILSGTIKIKTAISAGTTVNIGSVSTDYAPVSAVATWATTTNGASHGMGKSEG